MVTILISVSTTTDPNFHGEIKIKKIFIWDLLLSKLSVQIRLKAKLRVGKE